MHLSAKSLLPTLAACLTLAACGGSSYSTGSSSSASSASTSTPAGVPATGVKTASNATLGATVLTDARGMTLYSLSAERGGRFICASSPCTQLWSPLRAAGAGAPSGPVPLARITRPDGSQQVTYKGLPLYTFAQDQRPGDAKGQGLKDVGTWSAVTVAAPAATSTQSTQSTPAAPAPSTGRSGY
jgi:predicted lipoprotein with Yx(FWY)xxD motif